MSIASGEFFLRHRPNGGELIFYRSLWVALWLFLTALGVRELVDPTRSATFDFERCRQLVAEHFAWFGTLFGASYAGFYARFSSQWTYLQTVYNSIMSASVRMDNKDADAVDELRYWKAAFIEDADTLHLATKPIFAYLIKNFIEEEGVSAKFIEATPGGKVRLARILREVTASVEIEAVRQLQRP